MKQLNNVESSCCGSAIMWNITTDENPIGLCLECGEWSSVIDLDKVNV